MSEATVYIAVVIALFIVGGINYRKGNRLLATIIHFILCPLLLPVAALGVYLLGSGGTGWAEKILCVSLLIALAYAFFMFVISIRMDTARPRR
jgi:uncharacterized membrane protein YfcA